MKKTIFLLTFALGLFQLRPGLGDDDRGLTADTGRRPFSWYYPYSYQYYYPRHHYDDSYSEPYHYQGGCYWVYIEGNYYYYCNK